MLKTIKSLQGVNILSKEAQKKVQGGVIAQGGSTCAVFIPTGHGAGLHWGDGGMNYSSATISPGGTTVYGVSSSNASGSANSAGAGAHWCCAHCSTASWYHSA